MEASVDEYKFAGGTFSATPRPTQSPARLGRHELLVDRIFRGSVPPRQCLDTGNFAQKC